MRITRAECDAMFAKYGEDRTGRMPVDLYVLAVLSSRNRIIALEDRQVGAYKVGGDYSFRGKAVLVDITLTPR